MVFTLCGALKQNCSKNFSNSSINYWLINVNYYSIKILQYNVLRCYGTPLYCDLLLSKKKNKSKYKDIFFYLSFPNLLPIIVAQWVRVLSTNLEVMSLNPAWPVGLLYIVPSPKIKHLFFGYILQNLKILNWWQYFDYNFLLSTLIDRCPIPP